MPLRTNTVRELELVTAEITVDSFEQIQCEYDVFTRSDTPDELILDTNGFETKQLETLSQILNLNIAEFSEVYICLYHNHKRDWSEIEAAQ